MSPLNQEPSLASACKVWY